MNLKQNKLKQDVNSKTNKQNSLIQNNNLKTKQKIDFKKFLYSKTFIFLVLILFSLLLFLSVSFSLSRPRPTSIKMYDKKEISYKEFTSVYPVAQSVTSRYGDKQKVVYEIDLDDFTLFFIPIERKTSGKDKKKYDEFRFKFAYYSSTGTITDIKIGSSLYVPYSKNISTYSNNKEGDSVNNVVKASPNNPKERGIELYDFAYYSSSTVSLSMNRDDKYVTFPYRVNFYNKIYMPQIYLDIKYKDSLHSTIHDAIPKKITFSLTYTNFPYKAS